MCVLDKVDVNICSICPFTVLVHTSWWSLGGCGWPTTEPGLTTRAAGELQGERALGPTGNRGAHRELLGVLTLAPRGKMGRQPPCQQLNPHFGEVKVVAKARQELPPCTPLPGFCPFL